MLTIKHMIFAVYIFSVIYCYIQLNNLVDKALDMLLSLHPNIPVDSRPSIAGVRMHLEMLVISTIPILNLLIGLVFETTPDSVVEEIVSTVEMKHGDAIREAEKAFENLEKDVDGIWEDENED